MLKKFALKLNLANAIVLLTYNLQASMDRRAESRVVALYFSPAFDVVNHQVLLFKLRLMGIGCPLFNFFKEFLTDRKQHVTVHGKFRPVVSLNNFYLYYSLQICRIT